MLRVASLALLAAAAAGAISAAQAPAQSDGVLVVGDSLEVGTGPYLRRELGSTALTIDARKSRPSGVGLGVLEQRLGPGHRVVVFDLGVNDDPSQPAALARNLQSVRRIAGDRCLVVATLSRPPLNGVRIDGMNRAIGEFVAHTPGAQLFDWHAATTSDPGLLGRDGLHPGPAGYAARAQLLAEAIGGCLAPAAPGARDDEDIPAPRDRAARPPARSRSAPRRGPLAWQPLVADLLRRLDSGLVGRVLRSAIDRVNGAGHEMAGPVSPPLVEPILGAPPGKAAAGKHRPERRRR